MSRTRFDFSQTAKFAKNLLDFTEGFDAFVKNEMNYSALKLIMDIKDLTPVDSGVLKLSWKKTNVYTSRKQYHIDILNDQDYASYMEDGYYTSKTPSRFVPGVWSGKKFIYQPNKNSEGMMLKRKWIEGKHMYRISVNKWEHFFDRDWNISLIKYAKKKRVI